jgi:hypothetical protein
LALPLGQNSNDPSLIVPSRLGWEAERTVVDSGAGNLATIHEASDNPKKISPVYYALGQVRRIIEPLGNKFGPDCRKIFPAAFNVPRRDRALI